MRWPIDKPLPCSFLFVPGDSREKLRKSWLLGSGALIFDLEDAVSEPQKHQARKNVRLALESAPGVGPDIFVRINDCSTSYWKEDVSSVTGNLLTGIFLPKCESPEDLSAVSDFIEVCEMKNGIAVGSISVIALIESARGLTRIPQIIGATGRLIGLALGGEDYCLRMGVSRTAEGLELQYARSCLAVWARSHGLLAIDTVYVDFHDDQGLMRESRIARQLGFTAKLAVHPKQLEPIRSVFSPSEEELAEAKRVVQAFAAAQAEGTGTIALDGKMIDRPALEQARRLIASGRRR